MIEACVACGSATWSSRETCGEYRLAVCGRCGMTFTTNPDYAAGRYVAAYEGGNGGPLSPEHGYVYLAPTKRLELESAALLAPPPRLTPAQRLALRWLTINAPPGSTVIDCGCGSGLFLRALRKPGLRGVGVEVSPALVRMLGRRALEAVQGAAPDFPWKEEPPFAITFFEVLEHVPVPSEIVGTIARRFPRTAILASVPSPVRAGLLLRGERGPSDQPPNHFLRWTPMALEIFFHDRGFTRVTVLLPPPRGSEFLPGLGQLLGRASRPPRALSTPNAGAARPVLRVGATALLWLHKFYQTAADILGAPLAWRARARGASASSMLAVAEPQEAR